MHDQFAEQGYASPFRVLSIPECQRFLRAAFDNRKEPPLDWDKGNAVSSRAFYEISTHPAIIEVVAALLGEDIMLWGASIQIRSPDTIHPWHSDIESVAPPGKTVSVWVGLEHTTCDSSLQVVPYSNQFGVTVQEVRHQSGKGRGETTNEDIIRWARERDVRSHLMKLEMTDGEALFFDGNLWHCSHNVSSKTRQALLLQYATPDTMIRIPDSNYLDWPFLNLKLPRPACLMVRGSANTGVNRIVSAPVAVNAGSSRQLTSCIYPLRIPLPLDKPKGWKPYPIFSGSTADLRFLSCHVSVLSTGECPHPPHTHQEEEILVVLKGEVDIILPDAAKENRRKRLKSGEFVYYPSHFAHTLQTVSQDPANYLMFKWHSQETETNSPLAFGHFGISERQEGAGAEDCFCPRLVFEGPTAYLRKLHCHVSTLAPGSGYEPHVDAYDVGIIVLEGEIETLGERINQSVIFYRGGEPHGMRNSSSAIARYVVFEFHGSQVPLDEVACPNPDEGALPNRPSLFAKVTDPQRWKRKLKYLLKSFINGATRNTD
jgi:uncharacterized cupin superfamily protein